jgi:hypothetical protein
MRSCWEEHETIGEQGATFILVSYHYSIYWDEGELLATEHFLYGHLNEPLPRNGSMHIPTFNIFCSGNDACSSGTSAALHRHEPATPSHSANSLDQTSCFLTQQLSICNPGR